MRRAIPTIQHYMTSTPEVIGPNTTVERAQHLFESQHIRHLPVVRDERLVGLVSDVDLRVFEALDEVDASRVPVHDVMQQQPFQVEPDMPLDEVVHEMAAKKVSSAVVVTHGRVVGIFTTVDAMNAFSELLQTRLVH